jgi:tripartite ATP-independent transporter DctM subunit
MTWFVLSIFILILLLLCGEWIAFAIGIAGITSLYPKMGFRLFSLIGTISWETCGSFVLAAVPLFILMGELISGGGLTDRLYSGLSKSLRGVKGGLVQTNIAACTFFAAASGSSVASAATMGRVAYPDMISRGYDKSLVLGSIAAGGTLGILIPPSVIFIIYGSMSEESVGKLFMAGFFPGLIMAGMFMIYIAVRAVFQPTLVPADTTEAVSLREKLLGFIGITPFLVLILVVLGSIYGGIATPTEAAAVGATGTLVLSAIYRRLTPNVVFNACLNTVRSTTMIFLILIAAKLMAMALAYYRIIPMIEHWGAAIGNPMIILLLIILLYLILGMFFDAISMMVLTLPFVLPLIKSAGFDPIWFGVILVILIEMGLLTPPVGINLFVLQGVTGAHLMMVVRGSYPFVILQGLVIILLTYYPQIALWLPATMIAK